jgi:hypothetical protein
MEWHELTNERTSFSSSSSAAAVVHSLDRTRDARTRPNALPHEQEKTTQPTLAAMPSRVTPRWYPNACLADHVTIASHLPRIMGAYVGPNAIEAATNEKIMLTVNGVNDCEYCTGASRRVRV